MKNVTQLRVDSVVAPQESHPGLLLANLFLLAVPAATCYLLTTVMSSTAAAFGCLACLVFTLFLGTVSSHWGKTDPEVEAVSFLLTVHFCAARLPFVIPTQQVAGVFASVPTALRLWNAYLRKANLEHRQCDLKAIQDYFGIVSDRTLASAGKGSAEMEAGDGAAGKGRLGDGMPPLITLQDPEKAL
ncbi:hypothetical protein FB451DRAFT_1482631 [Mycena latifolia]|nr:hypothetical protein FB451DRAFT_1482631 [Mycena latifolia]